MLLNNLRTCSILVCLCLKSYKLVASEKPIQHTQDIEYQSLVNTYFNRIFSVDQEIILNELPVYDSISKKFAQIYAEIKLLSILDDRLGNPSRDEIQAENDRRIAPIGSIVAGFVFDAHLPQRRNRNFQALPMENIHQMGDRIEYYMSRISQGLTSALRDMNLVGFVRNNVCAALDIIDDDDLFASPNAPLLANPMAQNLSNLPATRRGASGSWIAEQEFINFVNSHVSQTISRYCDRNQCGDLLYNNEFRAQIKMAIGVEVRHSEKYRNIIEKKSAEYERDFPSINDSLDSLEPVALESLSEIEQKYRYMRLTKQIIDRILS